MFEKLSLLAFDAMYFGFGVRPSPAPFRSSPFRSPGFHPMYYPHGRGGGGGDVPVWVMVVIGLVLLAFAGWVGYEIWKIPTPPTPPTNIDEK